MINKYSYIIFNKPYGVLSQFTPAHGHEALCNYGPFPKNVYVAGRLDADSEGLLFLTNDNKIKHLLTHPKFEHEKTYLVQVEGIPNNDSLIQLQNGVIIEGKLTKKAKVTLLSCEPKVEERSIPIRFRKNIPTSWIQISITEGRNRQIRKMTAAVGHPTLRLIRTSIEFMSIEGLNVGKSRNLTKEEKIKLYQLFV